MKKTLFIFIFLISSLDKVCGQGYSRFILDSLMKIKSYDSLIVWNKQRKLNFSDFQGTPDTGLIDYANTYYNISLIYNLGEPFTAYAVCYFNKVQSWMKKDLSDQHVLDHEQCHFDIAEIVTRKLNIELQKIKVVDDSIFQHLYNVHSKYLYLVMDIQRQFDSETGYSSIFDKQKYWNLKIKKSLESGGSFAPYW